MINSSASPQIASSQSISLQQTIQKILHSGRITAIDRQWLHRISTSDFPFSETELKQLRLIHDRLRMGIIKVIDS